MAKGVYTQEYAVYKGDDLIVVGNAKECADFMGVSMRYIHRLATPTHHNFIRESYKNPDDATYAIRLEVE